MKLHLKKVTIEENLLNNSRSCIYLWCATHKGFSSLSQNIAAKNLLNGKVNYEKLKIYIEIVCLGKGLVQSQDEEYMIPMSGNLWIPKDQNESLINESESVINLYAEINNHNWMKLKSDLLLVETKRFTFEVAKLTLDSINENEECFESNIKLSLHKYEIELS